MRIDAELRQDAHRLPEGMRRIAYDADTQRYTFRDRSGQLYQSAPGEEYGVLKAVAAPLPQRRNVTITGMYHFPHSLAPSTSKQTPPTLPSVHLTELPDPALRQWSLKPAKTFGDILPSDYITAAQSGVESPTSVISSSERLVQAAMPKVQGVVEVVRRRTTMRRPAGGVSRSGSLTDEKRRLLEDESWEVVRKGDLTDGRIARSKSEMRPSRYYTRK